MADGRGRSYASVNATLCTVPICRSRSIIRKHSEEKHIGILLLSISTIFIICQSFKVR